MIILNNRWAENTLRKFSDQYWFLNLTAAMRRMTPPAYPTYAGEDYVQNDYPTYAGEGFAELAHSIIFWWAENNRADIFRSAPVFKSRSGYASDDASGLSDLRW
ncbi:MAG: hypothetical protein CMI08_18595 [Oceanospirillaceae bacterium]|nr:hypothetical protein [Oceanospirillaceae bacterium]MBL35809.1 hypothetical protein [Oceanospirillaceae bacterium]